MNLSLVCSFWLWILFYSVSTTSPLHQQVNGLASHFITMLMTYVVLLDLLQKGLLSEKKGPQKRDTVIKQISDAIERNCKICWPLICGEFMFYGATGDNVFKKKIWSTRLSIGLWIIWIVLHMNFQTSQPFFLLQRSWAIHSAPSERNMQIDEVQPVKWCKERQHKFGKLGNASM